MCAVSPDPINSKYYLHLPIEESPTYYNLHHVLLKKNWLYTEQCSQAHLSERHFQFDAKVTETLEYKHQLAEFIHALNLDVMPLTYSIHDHNYFRVIDQIEKQSQLRDFVWILKPALLNNGQSIKIFHSMEDLKQHYATSNRLGGPHVLQHYIQTPHLLNQHKYSIRMFMVLANDVGNFLYPDGYLNVAKEVYRSNDFSDLRSHITNEHLQANQPNVIQVPTKPIPGFSHIYRQIKTILSAVSAGLLQQNPEVFYSDQARKLAIFGVDFLVDVDLRVWLLEANHGPCFPRDIAHPLQKPLYNDFWEAFIACFVLPIACKDRAQAVHYQPFESLGPDIATA